jgi:replication factor A1
MSGKLEIEEKAEQIHNDFADVDGVDTSKEDLAEKIKTFVTEYKVPVQDAADSQRNRLRRESDMDDNQTMSGSPDNETVALADIENGDIEDDAWVDVEAEVAQLWESDHGSIIQTGLLADDSGTLKFTAWATSFDEAPLSEGDTVALGSVKTSYWEGGDQWSVELNKATEITAIDAEFEVDQTEEFTGSLVAIQGKSGLIKRCPKEDCTRVLQNGSCSEHGEVEGEFDLRIKAVLDNGQDTQEVLLDREMTEALTGVSLEDAKSLAMDALDTDVVAQRFCDMLETLYFEVSGPIIGRYLLVEEIDVGEVGDAEQALIEARSEQALEA